MLKVHIPMYDKEIRNVLLQCLHEKYDNDSDTLIIEEFGLCQGNARVDIAVINGTMHGYEIKSENDSLQRLPRQKSIYNEVFDYVTIVASTSHLPKIIPIKETSILRGKEAELFFARVRKDESKKVSNKEYKRFLHLREGKRKEIIHPTNSF